MFPEAFGCRPVSLESWGAPHQEGPPCEQGPHVSGGDGAQATGKKVHRAIQAVCR